MVPVSKDGFEQAWREFRSLRRICVVLLVSYFPGFLVLMNILNRLANSIVPLVVVWAGYALALSFLAFDYDFGPVLIAPGHSLIGGQSLQGDVPIAGCAYGRIAPIPN